MDPNQNRTTNQAYPGHISDQQAGDLSPPSDPQVLLTNSLSADHIDEANNNSYNQLYAPATEVMNTGMGPDPRTHLNYNVAASSGTLLSNDTLRSEMGGGAIMSSISSTSGPLSDSTVHLDGDTKTRNTEESSNRINNLNEIDPPIFIDPPSIDELHSTGIMESNTTTNSGNGNGNEDDSTDDRWLRVRTSSHQFNDSLNSSDPKRVKLTDASSQSTSEVIDSREVGVDMSGDNGAGIRIGPAIDADPQAQAGVQAGVGSSSNQDGGAPAEPRDLPTDGGGSTTAEPSYELTRVTPPSGNDHQRPCFRPGFGKIKNLPFPLSSEYHLMDDEANFYSTALLTNEDIFRYHLHRMSGFGFVESTQPHNDEVECSTHRMPYTRLRFTSVNEFWICNNIRECVNYSHCERLLRTGQVQLAIRKYNGVRNITLQGELLVLLRLVCACRNSADLLASCGKQIYTFLTGIMDDSDFHMTLPVRKRVLSDSEAYGFFLPMAFAAHTIPIVHQTSDLPLDHETMYRNHVSFFYSTFKDRIDPNNRDSLPEILKQFDQSLTSHNMAMEIMLCLYNHEIHAAFLKSVAPTRVVRVIERSIKNGGMTLTKLQLVNMLLSTPRQSLLKLESPFALYQQSYYHVSWAITKLLKSRSTGELPEFSLRYAVTSMSVLIQMTKWPYKEFKAYLEFQDFIFQPQRIAKLLYFVLTFHTLPANCLHKDLYDLKSTIWSFLYQAPLDKVPFFDEITSAAVSDTLPNEVCGPAAMYVAIAAVFRGHRSTKTKLLGTQDNLIDLIIRTTNWRVRNRRYEVSLYMDVILKQCDYGVDMKMTGVRTGQGLSDAFQVYTFSSEEPVSLPSDDEMEEIVKALM